MGEGLGVGERRVRGVFGGAADAVSCESGISVYLHSKFDVGRVNAHLVPLRYHTMQLRRDAVEPESSLAQLCWSAQPKAKRGAESECQAFVSGNRILVR